jgi:DNA polymerase/3'-5' exonuclease PolX
MKMKQKRPYNEVLPIAQRIVAGISPYCERVEIAGSLRRKRPLIGDIEIVALPKRAVDLFGQPASSLPTELDLFLRARLGDDLVKDGGKYKQFPYAGHQVDLFLPASAGHWGCIYLIRTGSYEFNQWLMNVQQRRAGVLFREGLLHNSQGVIPTPEEEDVFEALGLPFIPPELRDSDQSQNWPEIGRKNATLEGTSTNLLNHVYSVAAGRLIK